MSGTISNIWKHYGILLKVYETFCNFLMLSSENFLMLQIEKFHVKWLISQLATVCSVVLTVNSQTKPIKLHKFLYFMWFYWFCLWIHYCQLWKQWFHMKTFNCVGELCSFGLSDPIFDAVLNTKDCLNGLFYF
jgi:hypothetical protein